MSTCSRSDLAHSVNRLAQFSKNPNKTHLKALERLWAYLRGSVDLGIVLAGALRSIPRFGLVAFSHADWAGDQCDFKSVGGHLLMFNGSPIVWRSKKLKAIATSTAAAEYMAAFFAATDLVWAHNIYAELGETQSEPSILFEDNRACIVMTNSLLIGEKAKHINIKFSLYTRTGRAGNHPIRMVPDRRHGRRFPY